MLASEELYINIPPPIAQLMHIVWMVKVLISLSWVYKKTRVEIDIIQVLS